MSDQDSTTPPGHKVFTGNLAYVVNDDALRSFFSPVADDIISAQVITRGTRSAGYGFVTVKTLAAAQRACELLDKKELEGRQVVVEVAKPAEQKEKERNERRSQRRAGRARGKAPPGEVSEAEATGDVKPSENGGSQEVQDERKRVNKKKRFTRKKGKKPTDAGNAAETTAEQATGDAPAAAPTKRVVRPSRPKKEPRPQGQDPVGEPSNSVLFVANLGFSVDDAGLTELFTSAGINVVSARVVRRRWGKPRKSKGYGFVDVGGEEEQKKAIAALQNKSVDGREIAVKVAVNAKQLSEDDGDEAHNSSKEEGSPEATIVAS